MRIEDESLAPYYIEHTEGCYSVQKDVPINSGAGEGKSRVVYHGYYSSLLAALQAIVKLKALQVTKQATLGEYIAIVKEIWAEMKTNIPV